MKLLVLTQAVDLDDPVLSFFHRWIEEFSGHCDAVEVICLRKGRFSLPSNVAVHSLGKERGVGRLAYIANFYRLIWRLRYSYDAVFVHMNPEYVVLGGILWKLWRKRTGLWYVHRAYPAPLRVAVPFVDAVFTSAATSTTLQSPKVRIVGHGIDTAAYSDSRQIARSGDRIRILTVGRVTPIKNLEVIIEALAYLKRKGIRASLRIVGAPIYEADVAYKKELEKLITIRDLAADVVFEGPIAHDKMPSIYAEADLSINACPTGGVDKAVLESMASGVPALAANESFKEFFGEYSEKLLFPYGDASALAELIQQTFADPGVREMGEGLRALARERADVSTVVSAIMAFYGTGR